MARNLYKIGWKAERGFEFEHYWNKKEWERKINELRKQKKWFRAWKVGNTRWKVERMKGCQKDGFQALIGTNADRRGAI